MIFCTIGPRKTRKIQKGWCFFQCFLCLPWTMKIFSPSRFRVNLILKVVKDGQLRHLGGDVEGRFESQFLLGQGGDHFDEVGVLIAG